MASRLSLHEELCTILGTRNVYFNSPESVKLKYPCIVYSRTGVNKLVANNGVYRIVNQYTITTIDTNPDSVIADTILTHFMMCSFDRGFKSDSLNHNVLTLYY